MAWSFGDSFDLYAAPADMANGYWDSVAGTPAFVAGRLLGSQALAINGNSQSLVKSSGVNDAVHHLVVSFRTTFTIGGSSLALYFGLFDGVTAQCSVVFRTDGAILLTSGGPAGTVLATYTGAFPVVNTWYAFEIEVTINNTTGSFAVRKNGNTVNDFTLGSLNTRGGTANNYANRLQIGESASINQDQIDDLFWRSDASSVAWLGDIRCYARMPASDASVTFSRAPANVQQTPFAQTTNYALGINTARYAPFTALVSGSVGSITIACTTASTANVKCAIYATSAGLPTTVLGSATPVSAPAIGTVTFTFGTPVSVVAGTTYIVATDADATSGNLGGGAGTAGYNWTAATYSAFPTNNPTVTSGIPPFAPTVNITPSPSANWQAVSEPQQDALTSYVYDSTPGDADFYGIASIASTPATVIATTVRAYAQKSDAGTRTMAVQLKSPSGGGAPTIWNASDQVRATLTNANLTATLGSSAGVRAVGGKNSGKFYFEITATNWTGLTQAAAGLALASVNLTNVFNAPPNAIIAHSNNNMYSNSFGAGGSLGTIANGNVIAFAIDMTAQMAWIRLAPSGFWNGASGTVPDVGGGFSLAWAGSALLYPVVSAQDTGAVFTANFGDSAFVGAIPPGYTAGWLGASGTTVVSPTLVLTTSGWQWAWRTDLVDPGTGAAWTPAAVNNAQVGPKVIA